VQNALTVQETVSELTCVLVFLIFPEMGALAAENAVLEFSFVKVSI